jgi:hypothetical protein
MADILEDATRLIIEVDAGVGDEVQFTKMGDGLLNIEIDEPWAGSTETGFGATASVSLNKEQVARLITWLQHP